MRLRRQLTAALAAALALVCAAAAQARPALKVMTRDVYVGADTDRPFHAILGKPEREALVAFGNGNWAVREIVGRTDFPSRAVLLADEILSHEPDLVGLQDVALWRRGPLDYGSPGEPVAEQVDHDFLHLLLEQLGGEYEVVRSERELDHEGPAFPGEDPEDPAGFNSRLTTYDVILKRRAARLRILRTGSRSYRARLRTGVYDFVSGYAWADFRLGGRRMRFITTQLEPRSQRTALAQLEQLIAGPVRASRRHPTILVCGCHSDPEAARGTDRDLPGRSVHRRATQVFEDQWLRIASSAEGHTASFGELLDDADLTPIDRRTDFVFGRRPAGNVIRTLDAWVVGTGMRTPSGLWPSDHAGIVARLRP